MTRLTEVKKFISKNLTNIVLSSKISSVEHNARRSDFRFSALSVGRRGYDDECFLDLDHGF
jgi:hypothetical protein